MQPIMTVEEIKKYKNEGWEIVAYGGNDGFISEVSFCKKTSSELAGFSYMCCELRQRTLKRLFNRIQTVIPSFKLTV